MGTEQAPARPTEGQGTRRARARIGAREIYVLAGVAALKLGIHIAVAGRYGWHRDEFYYVVGGRNLDWGFVDHPPLTPLVAGAVDVLFGPSQIALRLTIALAGVGVVVVTALIARELGATFRGMALAGIAAVATPVFLGAGALFGTTGFNQLFAAVLVWATIRLVRTRDLRWWVAVGAALGLGLASKYLIAVVAAALLVGIIATSARVVLRSWWAVVGAAVAVLLVLPSLVWQVAHDMPFVEFTNNMASRDGNRIRFVIEVFVMAGPVGLVLMPFGFRRLWRAETQRWLAVVVGTGLAILLVLAGKGYYAAPFYVPMLAAAAVHFDPGTTPDRRARRRGALVAGLLAAQLVLVLPVTLPVLPPRVLAETDLDATFTPLAEQTGWPETIDDVEEVSTDLTPVEREHAVILAASYGEAGALDVLGSDALPPVVSAHNQYWFWGPPADTTDTVIGVRYQAATLAPFFDTCEQVAVFENAAGIATEVAGTPVVLCRGRRAEWPAIWDDLQHFE